MKRLFDQDLLKWKNKAHRKPLLLRGSRQVGKTWAIRNLGKSFENFIEINLEERPELHSLFDKYLGQPEKLIEQLGLVLEQKIQIDKTLLFIDEIQENANALISLRYFYEKLPQLHVAAAGSLLEFSLKEISFPVGRIEFLYIFPMNFFEYLLAIQREDLIECIQEINNKEISLQVHNILLDELKTYYFLGGMPEVIQTYLETKDLRQCSEKQAQLINTFRMDFNKYAKRTQISHLKLLFDSVPRQFGQKFVYANITSAIKTRELSFSLDLLCGAGLVYKCYHSSSNGVPLSAELNNKKFKIFFLDIGLALKLLGINPKELPLLNYDDLINRGGLAEQFVHQELISQTDKGETPQVFYWHREAQNSSAEVDFVQSVHEQVIPIEVKSGPGRSSKSLSIFIAEKKSPLAMKISTGPFSINETQTGKMICLPFYGLIKKLNLWIEILKH